MKAPRIVVAGVKGKVGKTVVALALINGLREMGFRVQAFKAGCDFIDPSYHTLFSERPSRNLDSVMFTKEVLLASFLRNMLDADVAVVEGVFGLYDSLDGVSERGSTAEVSKILQAPVVLVVDAERVNRSLIALIQGFRTFDPSVNVRGLVVNNVANVRQGEKIRRSIESFLKDVEMVGIIPRSVMIEQTFRYRHLGLTPVAERGEEVEKLGKAVDIAKEHLDIKKIVEIAKDAEELENFKEEEHQLQPYHIKVGVVRDDAFSFYYPENLEHLQNRSERIFYIDALRDSSLPDVDLLCIGGGFPEVYANLLEKNRPLLSAVRHCVEKGMVVYAECGGLIYLVDRLQTFRGEEYDMLGLIDGSVEMVSKPVGHGYTRLKTVMDNPLTRVGEEIIGHEFHHSRLHLEEKVDFAFKVTRGYGVNGTYDGIVKRNLLATYTHLHVLHNPSCFDSLLRFAAERSH